MSNRSTRLSQILALLKEERSMDVKELAARLGVSDMTVRRDLELLRADHLIERSHGSASYCSGFSAAAAEADSYELQNEQIKMNAQKDAIGRFAAGLIQPGDVIIVDTGSTTDRLARYIPEDSELTVVCYNYNILAQMVRKRGVDIIFGGGFFHGSDQMFESPQSIDLIRGIRASKLFVSASGIHEKLGITCSNGYEVSTKRAVLESALTIILIADSSKFSKICTAYFAQLSEIDVIVTDRGLSSVWRETIERMQIELHLVD